jgi:ribosomal protein S18 acetylase RimI-like enzyme
MLSIRNFQAEDFDEYASWFLDEQLNKALGPAPDSVWLEHVLHDGEGCELTVIKDSVTVAVVGIHYHIPSLPFQTITDFAIKPELRRTGLGSKVLEAVIKHFELDWSIDWQCFVDKNNEAALAFFTNNGWERYQHPDSDGMIRCTFAG